MTSRSTELPREKRTVRVALSEVDFVRLCEVSASMNASPTQLAAESITYVVDQLAAAQMVDEVLG